MGFSGVEQPWASCSRIVDSYLMANDILALFVDLDGFFLNFPLQRVVEILYSVCSVVNQSEVEI